FITLPSLKSGERDCVRRTSRSTSASRSDVSTVLDVPGHNALRLVLRTQPRSGSSGGESFVIGKALLSPAVSSPGEDVCVATLDNFWQEALNTSHAVQKPVDSLANGRARRLARRDRNRRAFGPGER